MNPRTRRLRKFRRRFRNRAKYDSGGKCWECGRKFVQCDLAIKITKECEEIVARMTLGQTQIEHE